MLIAIERRAAGRPKIIQHNIHGTATKSILIKKGVRKRGGRIWRMMEREAEIAAPTIAMVGLGFLMNPLKNFVVYEVSKSEMSRGSRVPSSTQ